MAPKVNVIVPLYNQEQYIGGCIKSILDQSFTDFEIIVVNDGSTDNSSGAIPRDDERVYITHTLSRGASSARNEGINQARGEFVMFVDADDYLEPEAIRRLVDSIDGCDLVCGSFRKFGNFEMVVSHETRLLTMQELAGYVMMNLGAPRHHQMLSGCWAKLFRQSLVGKFPKLTTAEDMAFNFDYLKRCSKVRFIDNVVYNNRKHNGSLSMSFNENDRRGLFGFLDGLKYVEGFLRGFYAADEIERAIDNSKVYHSMLYAQRIGPDALKKVFS